MINVLLCILMMLFGICYIRYKIKIRRAKEIERAKSIIFKAALKEAGPKKLMNLCNTLGFVEACEKIIADYKHDHKIDQ